MWNWLKSLLGFGEKEYHHLLDAAHRLQDELSAFIQRKETQAADIRDEIDAKVADLHATTTVSAAAQNFRAGVLNALVPPPLPVKAAPADAQANVAAQ